MDFSGRLDKAITEALMAPDMLSAQSTVEQSKQAQRVKMVEGSLNAAVTAIERIERLLREPDMKRIPNVEPIANQLKAISSGLGDDGVLRRNLVSVLTTPAGQAPKDKPAPGGTELAGY